MTLEQLKEQNSSVLTVTPSKSGKTLDVVISRGSTIYAKKSVRDESKAILWILLQLGRFYKWLSNDAKMLRKSFKAELAKKEENSDLKPTK